MEKGKIIIVWNVHINRTAAAANQFMGSVSVWNQLTAVKYWLLAVLKDVINWQYLTSAAWNNILNISAIRYTFKVYERLKREQHIHTLFLSGKAFSVFPVRFIYLLVPCTEDGQSPVMTGFSVPKKKFRSSVHRHRIRRLMAEAWRLNKYQLYPAIPAGQQLHLFIIFTDTRMPDYQPVLSAVIKGIDKLLLTFLPPPEAPHQCKHDHGSDPCPIHNHTSTDHWNGYSLYCSSLSSGFTRVPYLRSLGPGAGLPLHVVLMVWRRYKSMARSKGAGWPSAGFYHATHGVVMAMIPCHNRYYCLRSLDLKIAS